MRLACAIGIATLVASAGAARADSAKADEKFKLGKKLLAQKHYAEACAAFEDSNKLDPGIGAELNIGHCYEEWGKLATAYRAYIAAEEMAKSAHDPRLPKIRGLMHDLDPQVPRLTVDVAKGASTKGLVVTLDGEPFAKSDLGSEQRIDPGPHRLEYRVGSDGAMRNKLIPLERGGSSNVTLELAKPDEDAAATAKPERHDKPVKPDAPVAKDPSPDPDGGGDDKSTRVVAVSPGHARHVQGVVVMAGGVVAMGIAGGLTIAAHSKYKSALSGDCGGSTTMCDPAGLTATHSARSEANIASVVFAAGAAVSVVGIVLYTTAPHGRPTEQQEDALRLVPVASPNSAGLVLLGRF